MGAGNPVYQGLPGYTLGYTPGYTLGYTPGYGKVHWGTPRGTERYTGVHQGVSIMGAGTGAALAHNEGVAFASCSLLADALLAPSRHFELKHLLRWIIVM